MNNLAPKSALLAYQAFIDVLVETTHSEVNANRIRQHGHPERSNSDDLPYTKAELDSVALYSILSADQRELIARQFEEVRIAAVHDIAAQLNWMADCDGLSVNWKGATFANSPYASYQYDLVCRLEGDCWPDEPGE